MRLRDRVALVTGGGAGVGRSLALRFAREGAAVVVSDLDRTAAEHVAVEVQAAGGAAWAERADAASLEDGRALLESIERRFGGLHVLVNNAGLPSQYAHGDELERWDLGIEKTLSSAYRMSQLALPQLRRAGSSAIVNVCSIAGTRVGGPVWYASAKAGLTGLTRSLAVAHGRDGVRVNALCLGVVDTQRSRFLLDDPQARAALEQRTPLGRIGTADEAAAAALFLASDDASLITGQVLVADGGYTIG